MRILKQAPPPARTELLNPPFLTEFSLGSVAFFMAQKSIGAALKVMKAPDIVTLKCLSLDIYFSDLTHLHKQSSVSPLKRPGRLLLGKDPSYM